MRVITEYAPVAEVAILARDYGCQLEALSLADKSAIAGVLGLYFHGLNGTFEDGENYACLVDAYLDYPVISSENVQYVCGRLNTCTDQQLAQFLIALATAISEEQP